MSDEQPKMAELVSHGDSRVDTWNEEDLGTLRRILHPFDARTFVDEWWAQRSLFVKGHPGKFSGLFDSRRFFEAVQYGADRPHLSTFRLSAVVRDFDGAWSRTEELDPDEIANALRDGSTICVNDISVGDSVLSSVCEQVRREMSFCGSTRFNAYMSRNDSGTDLHIDTSVTTALQLEGRKRWRYARTPAIEWPRSNAQIQTDGSRVWSVPGVGRESWERLPPPRGDEFEEVVLEPGDLLCLPAGTWHGTRAVGYSLALNLAFSRVDFFNVLLNTVAGLFIDAADWRSGLPPIYLYEGEALPEAVGQFMLDRLAELQLRLPELRSNSDAMFRTWKNFLQ